MTRVSMNLPSPQISAVLVSRNSGNDLRSSISAILSEAAQAGLSSEVIVVDNASDDGSTQGLEDDYPQVSVVHNARNRGFGPAANQGFRKAQAEQVLLLNPDAQLQEGALVQLTRELEQNPDVCVVAPALLLDDGTRQESPRRFYTLRSLLARRTPYGRTPAGRAQLREHARTMAGADDGHEVDWVTGAAMLLRREAMPELGPFDERYFLYFEDVDLCRRMRATGGKIAFLPDAIVHHRFGGASRRQVPWNPLLWQHLLSGLLYLQRWSSPWWALRSIRTIGRAAGRLSLRALLLFGTGLLFLTVPQAVVAATLAALLIPLHARPALGRRPLPHLGTVILSLLAASATAVLATEGALSTELLVPLALWSLASLPLLRITELLLRGASVALARHGIGHRSCLLAGDPEAALLVAQSLTEQPGEGLHVAGFVPLEPRSSGGPKPRLASWAEVGRQAERLRIDSVLLCGSADDLARMTAGVADLRLRGVDPVFVLTGSEELLQTTDPPELAGWALLSLGSGLGTQLGRHAARAAELFLAGAGLLLLAPLWPLLFLASALAGKGAPVLRVQRLGNGMKAFSMFRLRSGPGETGDRGGGPLGRFLRWAHLDELPQLVNVLRGDMALVGPRPVEPATAAQLEPWQQARFCVRPGITGIWQLDRLRRWRLEQMIASDLLYVLRRSPGMDLRLLARTLLGRRNP